MTCGSCGDFGICLIVYEDDVKVYAVCLCPTGERWRQFDKKATGPAWHVWAAKNRIDRGRVLMLEDAVTPEELAARGFRELGAVDASAAIAAAARSRK